jgi:hypothetical protein
VENLFVRQIKIYEYTNKNWSFFRKYPCIRTFGAKKYNTAQIEYTKEHSRTKKTFAAVICVFAYLRLINLKGAIVDLAGTFEGRNFGLKTC